MCFWCFFHLFCIHISRVDFPAGTYAKVYSSINTCGFSWNLSLSVVENRDERHPTSEVVNFKVFSSLGYPSQTSLRDSPPNTNIPGPQAENHYDKELKGS